MSILSNHFFREWNNLSQFIFCVEWSFLSRFEFFNQDFRGCRINNFLSQMCSWWKLSFLCQNAFLVKIKFFCVKMRFFCENWVFFVSNQFKIFKISFWVKISFWYPKISIFRLAVNSKNSCWFPNVEVIFHSVH